MPGKERYRLMQKVEHEVDVVASVPDLRPKKEDESVIFGTPRFRV